MGGESFGQLEMMSFDQGLLRIESALKEIGHSSTSEPNDPIITSRSEVAKKLLKKLGIMGLPSGIKKWQLPVSFNDTGAQFFISALEPGMHVDEHSHDEGAGMRVLLGGSISYGSHELRNGDWMFIPKGTAYSFDVGDTGATIFYCYACCCVPV